MTSGSGDERADLAWRLDRDWGRPTSDELNAAMAGWRSWLAERGGDEELNALGIESAELPDALASALGPERTRALETQLRARLMELAASPPSRDELAAQARQFGPAARSLNSELGTRVVALELSKRFTEKSLIEIQRDQLGLSAQVEHLRPGSYREGISSRIDAHRAAEQDLSQRLAKVQEQLEALSRRPDHPDRWVEQHARPFTDGLAAGRWLQRVRGRSEEPDLRADQRTRDPPAPGLEPF